MQPFPVPANSSGAGLTAVSCTSPRFCEAVGSYFDNTAGTNVTLAAMWNGTSWSLQPTPNPGGFNFEQFNTVSCASPAFCEAWASGNAGNPGVTVAEQWNGSSWQLQTVPSDATVNSVSCAPSASLNAVSCTAASSCESVGQITDQNGQVSTLAEAWNGSAWTIQPTPNPTSAQGSALNAVSCTSATSCTATGTQIEVWDGTTWSLRSAPQNSLAGVSCGASQMCTAVGAALDAGGVDKTLIETGD